MSCPLFSKSGNLKNDFGDFWQNGDVLMEEVIHASMDSSVGVELSIPIVVSSIPVAVDSFI